MTASDDFPAVLADARAGQPAAIEWLYREYVPLVNGYVRGSAVRDPDDVVSEVFVAMVGRLRSFDGDESHFRSWLFTIAHHRVVDEVRRHARNREDLVEGSDGARHLVSLVDNESEAMNRLRARGVLQAIDGLTTDQRSVLLLRVVSDLSVSQVAEIVGKPQTAVKALQRRALQALKRALDDGELS